MTDVPQLTPDQIRALPRGEYAFPGPARDRMVAAILDGAKTATTTLAEEHRREGAPFPAVGDLEAVVDSDDAIVCVTRVTGVRTVALADVPEQHAHDEGEGFADLAQWRAAHEEFWTSPEFVAALGEPRVAIEDDTEVVLATFEVVGRKEHS